MKYNKGYLGLHAVNLLDSNSIECCREMKTLEAHLAGCQLDLNTVHNLAKVQLNCYINLLCVPDILMFQVVYLQCVINVKRPV